MAQPITQIDFYFDFPSPYSYLASTQLPKLADKYGVSIAYRPFRILEAMKIVGNRPTTVEFAVKGKYAGADLARWVRRYGVPFERNPNRRNFDWALLGQIVLAASAQGAGQACVNAIFPAVWASTDDIGDKAVLAKRLDAAGFAGAQADRTGGKRRLCGKAERRHREGRRARRVRRADRSSSATTSSSATIASTSSPRRSPQQRRQPDHEQTRLCHHRRRSRPPVVRWCAASPPAAIRSPCSRATRSGSAISPNRCPTPTRSPATCPIRPRSMPRSLRSSRSSARRRYSCTMRSAARSAASWRSIRRC